MNQRIGIRGFTPTLAVEKSPRAVALEILEMHAWWRQAVAEAGQDVTRACVSILRERSDDPLLALAACELDRKVRTR